MAGTTMLAYGVVFVLLLGEIDLSIGYVAGIGALVVAELQLPGSGHQLNGLIAIVIAVAVCGLIGAGQGSIVAYVGVPSFVVTLAGYLIWQGVILGRLEVPGSIIIQDCWITYTANYYFSTTAGWVIAAIINGPYALTVFLPLRSAHGRAAASKNRIKVVQAGRRRDRSFGTVAICNHGTIQGRHLGSAGRRSWWCSSSSWRSSPSGRPSGGVYASAGAEARAAPASTSGASGCSSS
jgi:ABC-type xylose transport system permease subunit